MKNTITEIIFEELPGQDGDLGLITLNRPEVLNALNHPMFIALDEHLAEWENKKSIKAVVIRAVLGRAFCAGGDIRYAYELKQKKSNTITKFFADEYHMNRRIFHFPKPYIALLDGITMGGGVGVSIHGSHRVGTERLVFAMPETGIGFYPDVGMTYYLARMSHKIGIYLGLTGARINYADCYALGIIQDIVSPDSLNKIISSLTETSLPDKNAVTQLLKSFALDIPKSSLLDHKKEIETCFGKNTVEEILHALETENSDWCHEVAKIIKTKSPTSLKVTLHALQEASKLNFDEAMTQEYQLTCRFMEGHDFFEGVRAVLIDKDQSPKWKPSMLTEVTNQEVEKYFTLSYQNS